MLHSHHQCAAAIPPCPCCCLPTCWLCPLPLAPLGLGPAASCVHAHCCWLCPCACLCCMGTCCSCLPWGCVCPTPAAWAPAAAANSYCPATVGLPLLPSVARTPPAACHTPNGGARVLGPGWCLWWGPGCGEGGYLPQYQSPSGCLPTPMCNGSPGPWVECVWAVIAWVGAWGTRCTNWSVQLVECTSILI